MRPNRMLVRHGPEPGGWTYDEIDPGDGPIIVALHNLPNLTKFEAVKETADLLDSLAETHAYRVGINPSGVGDVPGVDYWLGDAVTVESEGLRAGAFTLSLDRQRPGEIIYVPEVGAVVDPPEVRQANINKRMSNGTVGGRSKVAVPIGQARGQTPGDTPTTDVDTCVDILETYLGRTGTGSVSIPNGGGSTTSVLSLLTTADDGGSTDVEWDTNGFDVINDGIYHVRLMAAFSGSGGWTGIAEMFNAGPNGTADYYTAQLVFGGSVAELSIWYTRACQAGERIAATMSLWQNSGSARACTYAEAYVYSVITGCGTEEIGG